MGSVARIWELLPHDRRAVETLAAGLRLSPVVAQLLINRGLDSTEAARRFLDAPLAGLHKPELLPGVADAADRLLAATRARRRICVYGDYDADGITATAILLQGLRAIGEGPVDFYVPHRLEEGYGLNADALEAIARNGASTVVTVDCGIASTTEADLARQLGLELLITDHHEFKPTLPNAAALVHPRLPGTSYPFGGLSGSGVAFKLAWALCVRACGTERVTPRLREFLLDACMHAALGTVADVVPLQDENRLLVRHGLARLMDRPTVGLRALLRESGLGDKGDLRASDIGFRLAPRINAVGRLGCARYVVELLTTTSETRALELSAELERQNAHRQQLEKRMTAQAREILESNGHLKAPALVLAHEEWHPGVVGIVASRLAEQYARPVVLIALRRKAESAGGGPTSIGQGSGRSVPGFALHEALRACEEHLISHGGHRAAAGLKILPERIDAFRDRFCAYAGECFPEGVPPPRLRIDAEVPLAALTAQLVRDLDRLEPYGQENTRPLFLAGDLQIVEAPRKMGADERHMSFRVSQGKLTMRAVAFGMAERMEELLSGEGRCSVVFAPQLNTWQGRTSVELLVSDFQPGPRARLG